MTVSAELSRAFRLMSLICAFLVIGIHMPSHRRIVDAAFADGFCRVAVPFFFFASGFFFVGNIGNDGWWRAAIGKRIRTLLVPFFIWTGISFVLPCLYGGQPRLWTVNELIAFWGLDPTVYPGVVPYWYIRTLFLLCILSWFFVKLCVVAPREWIGLLVVAWLTVCPYHDVYPFGYPPMRRILPLDAVMFFNVGICVRMCELEGVFSPRNAKWALPLGIMLMMLKIILSLMGCKIAWVFGTLSVPAIVLGSIGALSVVTRILVIANYAFPVYMLHSLVMLFISRLLGRFSEIYFLLYLMTFISCVVLADITKRTMPKCYGILFGGR